ncbi:ABC transporter ATP-binding protein [Paenibacillus selenitireducens]|uniref:ABC transporter ATP-binding protein n=1 Tax=Paenibacillus selenitireducens TaxID=1324314 RepID=A0A1T2XAA6_9BACL|nr:ABC transporter ATP-binding protein [Paenibacillus selenitireducens]OPA76626.1 ABC transporter ATP-binding protein [Paenibacillus selenitireducens]
MNYSRHRKQMEKMYEDLATIKRWEKTKVNGETKFDWVVKLMDVPCRLSQKALASNGQTETTNQIAYETKLFISPDIEIKQGDLIEVTRGTVIRAYAAGEPFPYPTHQEISIQRKDKA